MKLPKLPKEMSIGLIPFIVFLVATIGVGFAIGSIFITGGYIWLAVILGSGVVGVGVAYLITATRHKVPEGWVTEGKLGVTSFVKEANLGMVLRKALGENPGTKQLKAVLKKPDMVLLKALGENRTMVQLRAVLNNPDMALLKAADCGLIYVDEDKTGSSIWASVINSGSLPYKVDIEANMTRTGGSAAMRGIFLAPMATVDVVLKIPVENRSVKDIVLTHIVRSLPPQEERRYVHVAQLWSEDSGMAPLKVENFWLWPGGGTR